MKMLHVLSSAFLLLVASVTHAESPPPAANPAVTVKIDSADGKTHWAITRDGDSVDIDLGSYHLVGKAKGEKRYYHRKDNGKAVVEVKSGDGSFKLKAPDDKLLRKVKLDERKLKVADNEENAKPYVVKTDDSAKAKVLDPAEQEIGEVKFDDAKGRHKLKDAKGAERYTVDNGKRAWSYGVLLMDGIPEDQRLVIVAELLARGR